MPKDRACDLAPPQRSAGRGRTREQLLEAAAAVFAERGFYGASVEEIAERAGHTRGAFYSNFADKDEVFLALIDCRLARGVEEVGDIIRSSGSHAELMTKLRERAARRGVDESWVLLHTEFELYAIRNPDVRSKLAARNGEERDALAKAVTYEFKQAGFKLPASRDLVGLMLKILDRGCDIEHIIDPEGVSQDAYFDAVTLFFESCLALAAARRQTTKRKTGRARHVTAPPS